LPVQTEIIPNFTIPNRRYYNMKVLYYDCFAGISGDMNLGAMIDLGVETKYLEDELKKLPVYGYSLKVERGIRKGISGTSIQVIMDEHRHNPVHEHHHYNAYGEIKQMILSSTLDENTKVTSISIFQKIAEAEAKIHNKPVDEVHFHEVGAIDSIVDIVGAAICLNKLAPDAVYCSTVELGGGLVHCAHGLYPVPAPATAELIKNMPVRKGTVDYEATTPTGAAILSACVNEFRDSADFKILKTGYGIGAKDSTIPNVLRVFICEVETGIKAGRVPSFIVECNIDDMNPELYDYIIDSLFAVGARDVYITPIIMKKSRPAVKLSVLCTAEAEHLINEVLFRETSTIGVRKYAIDKTMLDREMEQVSTKFGKIRVKSAFYQGVCIKSKPEYDDCNKAARESKVPLSHVYREVEIEISKKTDQHAQ
jgi:pyridinium-3,5-bisthiocarboxylic acid mononucleotide nickel chelatase